MTYHLDRGLFVENGAAILAERDRAARASSIAYHLLRNARRAAAPACPAPACQAAA